MPWLIRLFYIIGTLSPILSILILFSGGATDEETGEVITRKELWEQGIMPQLLLYLSALLLIAILIHHKQKIVRFLIALCFFPAITDFTSCGGFGLSIFFIVYFFIIHQLFFSKKTKTYFNKA